MNIRIQGDTAVLEGYVNAVERKSLPLWSRIGKFVERICKGAFARALKRNDNVRILLNHDPERDLGGTKDGNLELVEDNIGLHVTARVTDPEVVKKARNGDLVGWSFGFYDRDVEYTRDENGMPLRDVKDLDLEEVSILDKEHIPAYEGTLVTVRETGEQSVFYGETFEDEIHLREEKEPKTEEVPKQQETVEEHINYDEFDQLIADLKS